MHNGIKFILITLLLFCSYSAFSQDVIYTMKGAEIKCKVQDLKDDSVSYKEIGDASHLKFILRKEVVKIRYNRGFVDTLNNNGVVPLLAKENAGNIAIKPDTIKHMDNAKSSDNIKTPGIQKSVDVAKTIDSPSPVVSVQPIIAPKEDTIYTTDGKQLRGKITDIDETNINYIASGSTDTQVVSIKNVLKVRESNGHLDIYNTPNTKSKDDAKTAAKTEEVIKPKDEMATVLQNWKKKYMSTPLEIF